MTLSLKALATSVAVVCGPNSGCVVEAMMARLAWLDEDTKRGCKESMVSEDLFGVGCWLVVV